MSAIRCALFLALAGCCGAQDAPYERERAAYDDVYASHPETFSAAPNAFLTRVLAGRKPGKALDVGMGQGRNSLWLAENGWTVSGFDISPVAIDQALREAERRKLHIDAVVAPFEKFDWGNEKWDLIVFSYFFPQAALPAVWQALKPGGMIVIEGFHADTGRMRPIGGGYTDKQMFDVLREYRILLFEDVEDRQEWGLQYGKTNRLVRVLAQKPAPLPFGCTWESKEYQLEDSMCWGVGRWKCAPHGWQPAGPCPAPQQ